MTIMTPTIARTYMTWVDLDRFEKNFDNLKDHPDWERDLYVTEFLRRTDADIDRSEVHVRIVEWPEFSYEDQWAESYIGFALGMYEGKVNVVINKRYWDQASSHDRKVLIFHEMAHDLYDLEHTPPDEKYQDKLMYPNDVGYNSMFLIYEELEEMKKLKVKKWINLRGISKH